jgi:hypothetical protein
MDVALSTLLQSLDQAALEYCDDNINLVVLD